MLTTDAWVFLNISNPVCAWATYRSVLVSVPSGPGFISVWTAAMLKNGDPNRIRRELMLERHRATFFPQRVSRLKGMYCFTDLESAERALKWGSYFRAENLAELSLAQAKQGDRMDSNWISYSEIENSPDPKEAMDSYWSGKPYPHEDPIWEVLVEGRLIVLGVELREPAYKLIDHYMPESTEILELGRVAAWVGSDLGSSCGFLRNDGDYVVLDYLMDMREANDPAFLERIAQLGESGHPMRPEAVQAFRDDKVRVPDLRPFGFRKLKSEMPVV